MSARTTVAGQAAALSTDLQPQIDFPEIYGPADGLTELQAVLRGIVTAFDATRRMTEEPGDPS